MNETETFQSRSEKRIFFKAMGLNSKRREPDSTNMKSKNALCGLSIAVVLHFGVLAGSAQTNIYLYEGTNGYTGSTTNITLAPGTYIITAYGLSLIHI